MEESQHIKDELKRTERKAAQLYEFIGQKPGSIIPARHYTSILAWFKTPLMPQAMKDAFAALDWTPHEQVEYCEKKNNDWPLIQSQLENMIGTANEGEK
jgi:hypothetical protein